MIKNPLIWAKNYFNYGYRVKSYTLDHYVHPGTNKPLRVGFVDAFTYQPQVSPKKIFTSLSNAMESENFDILLAPEFSFSNFKKYNNLSMEHYRDELQRRTNGKDVLLIPGTFLSQYIDNSSYVFHNGEIIFRTIKHVGPYESFNIWGYEMGVEICNNSGILNRQGIKDLDFLFLISCGLFHPRTDSLKDEGVALVNDSGRFQVIKKQDTGEDTLLYCRPRWFSNL